ncbi:MAG TPA: hydrogenase formation protein HypD [Ignisphaera aggregans]|uniref:Hydrogenase formation protein HypD n=1 Tax=Ignisphaera aggregans TaxID=334771 RepID=A0A833DUK2_9CREN|nr:hydrogenase formation protein HypD [Ignisphaera aggregans]
MNSAKQHGFDIRERIRRLYIVNPESKRIIERIAKLAQQLGSDVKIMNFCGTHEWTISHYGIRTVIPRNVDLVAGPGCPVCITPGLYVEELIRLSFEGFTILTYGDAFRLPARPTASIKSLAEAKARGGDVVVVYSFFDAIKLARSNPGRKYIFFAIGFETTMPCTAEPLVKDRVPKNLMILSAYRFTPPIMRWLLESERDVEIHGVIAPGHVSSIIGASAWSFLVERYSIPTVVAGFEPVDILLAIVFILHQLVHRKPRLINEYVRVVRDEGNTYVRKLISEVYDVVDAYWRGVGIVPESGAALKHRYSEFDAQYQLGLREPSVVDDIMPGCRCRDVILGKVKPVECPHFMKTCRPNAPYGPCMVGSEGTCRIWAENLPQILNEVAI